MQALKKKQQGFTIIEVMIVLVIAAVILLIVFLAVPALQRNSRNTERKSDVGKVLALVNEYATNNGGSSPGRVCRYENNTVAAEAATAACPTTGAAPSGASTIQISGNFTSVSIAARPSSPPPAATDNLRIYTNASCDSATATQGGPSTRSIAAWFQLEPAVNQCQSS